MIKLVTIVGARPQFIKAGITSKSLRRKFNEILVHTGQHYDTNMSDIFFEEMNIPKPNYCLNIGSNSHAIQTANMMMKIEEVLLKEKPDGVILYGDTNSTLAGAIVAAKLLIPIFHIEAGPRTHCFYQPEEQNRIVTDHLSSICFAPTLEALDNLKVEGLGDKSICCGDVMYDALLHYTDVAEQKLANTYKNSIHFLFDKVSIPDEYVLLTTHRPENVDNDLRLYEILEGVNETGIPSLYPVHPRVKHMIEKVHSHYNNILFIEPLSYFQTLFFTKRAKHVITDSGGLHKEAYLHGIPCTTLLERGWEQTTNGNWNQFIHPDKETIIRSIHRQNVDKLTDRNQFGDGHSCEYITDYIENFYSK